MRSPARIVVLLGQLPLLVTLGVACSAEATMGVDASSQGSFDARTGSGVPDGGQGIRPDAQQGGGQADAMPAVITCEGADADAEPNDTQLTATPLAPTSDCNSETGSITGSVISGNEDWFTFDAEDDFGITCSVNPVFTLTGNVQMCMSFVCLNGNKLDLTCPNGTTDIGGGLDGCCAPAGFEFDNFGCAGTNDGTKVHVQVTAADGVDTCEAYTIDYDY